MKNIEVVTSYAQIISKSSHYTDTLPNILPVQVVRESKETQEPEKVAVQTASYVKPEVVAPEKPIAPPAPVVGPAELEVLVEKYAAQYRARKDIMMIIMKCESGFNPNAASGSFAGLYQFMASTWSSNRNAMGLDPNPALRFNAEEAIRTAAFKMGRDGYGAWPACSAKAFSQIGA